MFGCLPLSAFWLLLCWLLVAWDWLLVVCDCARLVLVGLWGCFSDFGLLDCCG